MFVAAARLPLQRGAALYEAVHDAVDARDGFEGGGDSRHGSCGFDNTFNADAVGNAVHDQRMDLAARVRQESPANFAFHAVGLFNARFYRGGVTHHNPFLLDPAGGRSSNPVT